MIFVILEQPVNYWTELLMDALRGRCDNVLPGNDQFTRGDRVVVECDPCHFKEMQTDGYGGWHDDMALVRHTSVLATLK